MEGREVVTNSTASRILYLNGTLESVKNCIKDSGGILEASLALSFLMPGHPLERIEETFTIPVGKAASLLGEIKADIEAELDSLNTLAVQEAQDQEVKNEQ
jgi:hypothetical protein